MLPQAILFDFDGVLANTENVHVAAWERTFGEMGWNVSPETCARAAEIDDRAFLADLFTRQGISDGDLHGWIGHKQAFARQALQDVDRLHRGVAELIEMLRTQTKLAVVSTSWRENIEIVLSRAGILDAFATVVAKEDVTEPKPAPDSYRKALERLTVAPEQAVALEDSPTGLAAARAAGIRVVAVGNTRSEGEWTGGAPYLHHLRNPQNVLKMLENL